MITVGLMSGTSLDGVDAVAWCCAGPGEADGSGRGLGRVLGRVHQPYDAGLRAELLSLNSPGADELHRAALAANAVARCYAHATQVLLRTCGLLAHQVRALGAHGQTVRHRPGAFDGTGYTLQLLNGALLAELSGIDVVCDLRSRDVAAGGQGAPLVPAFHHAAFGREDENRAVLNLGGIANLTLLPPGGVVRGFDCGPGNALLDHWVKQHLGRDYDADGAWSDTGQVQPGLLDKLLAEPFFQQPPPKSTGRDLFNPEWLHAWAGPALHSLSAADVQATLAELTACSAARALCLHQPSTQRLLVCGGGAFNASLMRRLGNHLPGVAVQPSDAAGLPAMQVEAAAFAWLAAAFVRREPGNLPAVTGARGLRPLGAWYPTVASRPNDNQPQAEV